MSGIGKMNKGTLEIDLSSLADALSDDARLNLIRYLCAEERLFVAVLEVVADGYYHQDDEEGSWSFSSEGTARLREKLLPLMPQAAAGIVREVLRQRDQAKLNERRSDKWAWKLFHAWPEHSIGLRPQLPNDFEWAPYLSDAEVAKIASGEVAP